MLTLNKLMLREKQHMYVAEEPRPIKDASQLSTDRRYQITLDELHRGSYQQAARMLRILQAEYPEAQVLVSLLAEAQLKAELEVT